MITKKLGVSADELLFFSLPDSKAQYNNSVADNSNEDLASQVKEMRVEVEKLKRQIKK